MASTWRKGAARRATSGFYVNEAGSVRVVYQAAELRDGRRAMVQRAQAFRKGDYRLSLDDGTIGSRRPPAGSA